MHVNIKVQWNNKSTEKLIKKLPRYKEAIMKGTLKAVDELSEIGLEEIRKSQSYHATEKIKPQVVGKRVIGGYINRTKGISYAEFGTGSKATTVGNRYKVNPTLKIWFTQNERAARYYQKRVNRHTGDEYYVVFPQRAQRKFYFAKKKIERRKPAVVKRNVLHELRKVAKSNG